MESKAHHLVRDREKSGKMTSNFWKSLGKNIHGQKWEHWCVVSLHKVIAIALGDQGHRFSLIDSEESNACFRVPSGSGTPENLRRLSSQGKSANVREKNGNNSGNRDAIVWHGWVPLYPNTPKAKLAFIRSILKITLLSLMC